MKKITENLKAKTKIIECSCEHEYQDEMYGRNKRIHNVGITKTKCTVCSSVKSGK